MAGRDARLARLEAVLFLSREPLHARKLARFANLADGTEARTLVTRLNEHYDRERRAFRVEEVGGGWQLRTRRPFAGWLRRLQHVPDVVRLSQPALESLAVIAYRQPVVRADVDAIRGVHCGEVIRQLMERDLVRVVGRSQELGRPYFFGTTKKFLTVFGLRDLSDLPRADLFRQSLEAPSKYGGNSDRSTGEGDMTVTIATLLKGTSHVDLERELEKPLAADAIRAAEKEEEWEDEGEDDGDDDEEDDDDEDGDWDEEDEGDWDEDEGEDEDDDDEDDEEDEELEEDEVEDLEEEEWDDEEDGDWEEVDDEDFDDEEDDDDEDEDDGEDEDEDEEKWDGEDAEGAD